MKTLIENRKTVMVLNAGYGKKGLCAITVGTDISAVAELIADLMRAVDDTLETRIYQTPRQ